MNKLTQTEVTRLVRKKLGSLYAKGFTKLDIAVELDVSEKAIYKWENGSMPRANQYLNLNRLCEENGVS